MATALREELFSDSKRRRRFLRSLARHPVESAELLASLPILRLEDLVNVESLPTISPQTLWGGRGTWSLGVTERLVLEALVHGLDVRSAFEIGTFNGGTTRMLAEAMPEDGRVVTVDLPQQSFDASQSPSDLSGARVGEVWRNSTAAHRVKQLLVDSLTFDPTEFEGQFDLVIIDGAHDYKHGLADTKTALRLARSGGVILFDDFTPYWVGLVRGIIEAAEGEPLARLEGTDLGVIVAR